MSSSSKPFEKVGASGHLFTLSLVELLKSFDWKFRAPGGRDFLIAFGFSTLVAAILFIVVAVGQKGPVRMKEILLGSVPGSDVVPIRVRSHPYRYAAINAQVREAFARNPAFASYRLVPQRQFSLLPPLLLPGMEDGASATRRQSWRAGAPVALALPMAGETHPVWTWALSRNGIDKPFPPFSRVIIASRSHFERYFDYGLYRKTLLKRAGAEPLRRFLPPEDEVKADIRRLTHLVLRVTEGKGGDEIPQRNVFHEFRILWVDGLPLPAEVAMVFPLSFHEMLLAARDRPRLSVFAEAMTKDPRQARRVREIVLLDTDIHEEGRKAFISLARCLGAVTKKGFERLRKAGRRVAAVLEDGSNLPDMRIRTYSDRPSFKGVLGLGFRSEDVDYCRQKAGLGDQAPPSVLNRLQIAWQKQRVTPLRWLGPGRMETLCQALRKEDIEILASASQVSKERRACIQAWRGAADRRTRRGAADGREVNKRIFGPVFLPPYKEASVFVPQDEDLTAAVKALLGWALPVSEDDGKKAGQSADLFKVFLLDPDYERLLTRHGILEQVAKALGIPFAVAGLLVVLFLMLSIVSIVISHRRRQYGLLVMFGAGMTGLRLAIGLQFMLIAFMSTIVGWGIAAVVISIINMTYHGSPEYLQAREMLGLDEWRLFDLPGIMEVAIVFAGMVLLYLLVMVVAMMMNGMFTARHPVEMITGRSG